MKKIVIILLCVIPFGFVFGQTTKKWVVSKDGKGNYTTVQAALNAVPADNQEPILIYIKTGVYNERLVLDTRKNFVTLEGEEKNSTILTYNNHAGVKFPNGDTVNTWSSASFFVYSDNFTAKNISFQNNAGFTAGQAVAVFANGNRLYFSNCNFLGFQDVLFCSGLGTKQFYEDCYIEGTTDFIFGPATAVFQNCHIHSKKNSHVTAASTPREIPFGFVFLNCKLTADTSIHKVSLGRPWQPNASVTYINCELGEHIIPEGWNNWKNPANELTARYAEFNSTGAGANNAARVKWAKILTQEEVQKINLKNIFGDWDPKK